MYRLCGQKLFACILLMCCFAFLINFFIVHRREGNVSGLQGNAKYSCIDKNMFALTFDDGPNEGLRAALEIFSRLVSLLNHTEGTVVFGGKYERENLFIEPTVIENVTPNDALMHQEIFGPILPILTVKNLSGAFEFVSSRDKPLAVYLFTNDQHMAEQFVNETSSGGVTINDIMMHMTIDTLPFGGVGSSGMGRYHGKFGFDTFSNQKAVLHRSFKGEVLLSIRYPPFDKNKSKYLEKTGKPPEMPDISRWVAPLAMLFGFIIGVFVCRTFY